MKQTKNDWTPPWTGQWGQCPMCGLECYFERHDKLEVVTTPDVRSYPRRNGDVRTMQSSVFYRVYQCDCPVCATGKLSTVPVALNLDTTG